MPDTGNQAPTPGELSRQVREVLGRFEALLNKLDTQFVSNAIFKLYSDGVARELEHLVKGQDVMVLAEKDRNDQLEKRISKVEGNITWVVRIVIAAVILAILAALGLSKS